MPANSHDATRQRCAKVASMAAQNATRRSWGTLRTMRNGRIQASYIYDGDGRRYYAIHTYDSKMDAEGWLASERRLIEMGEWSPPESRAKLQAVAGVTLREYAEQWMEHRDLEQCSEPVDEPRRGGVSGRTFPRMI